MRVKETGPAVRDSSTRYLRQVFDPCFIIVIDIVLSKCMCYKEHECDFQ